VMVAGKLTLLSPSQAYAKGATPQVLTQAQVSALETFADALVPGSRAAGVSQFVDSQLAKPAEESLLMVKYFGVPHPLAGFYQASLNALIDFIKTQFNKPITQLSAQQMDTLISLVSQDAAEGWRGPPASFVYFVLRSDAVDVVYGIESGFDDIGMPMMEHIKPTKPW